MQLLLKRREFTWPQSKYLLGIILKLLKEKEFSFKFEIEKVKKDWLGLKRNDLRNEKINGKELRRCEYRTYNLSSSLSA